eukprot:Skav203360  [mRNA]  locus=scaffold1076:598996:603299:+ [translate_table: standard]
MISSKTCRDHTEVSEVSSAPVRPEAHAPPISPIMPSSPSMPSGPPPKRGPGSHRHQTQPPGSPCLPGTPSHVVTSPTTSSPEYCRLARKSLTGWAQKACSQTLGTSAARVRGEEGSGSSLPLDWESEGCKPPPVTINQP